MTTSRLVKLGVAFVAFLVLLLPGLLMASTWTPINLIVAFCVVNVSVMAAIWAQTWKWPTAILSSLLIAIPPYPYWLFNDNSGHWYFHFFHGFTMQNLHFLNFAIVFTISLILFAVIFWALPAKVER